MFLRPDTRSASIASCRLGSSWGDGATQAGSGKGRVSWDAARVDRHMGLPRKPCVSSMERKSGQDRYQQCVPASRPSVGATQRRTALPGFLSV